MYELHPRYYKTVRIRFFQRLVNGMTAFINGLMEGLKLIIKCPVHGLQAFAQLEVEVVDRTKLVADMDKAADKQEEEGPEVIQHEHRHILGDDEDDDGWKKAHKEEYPGPG